MDHKTLMRNAPVHRIPPKAQASNRQKEASSSFKPQSAGVLALHIGLIFIGIVMVVIIVAIIVFVWRRAQRNKDTQVCSLFRVFSPFSVFRK